MGSTKAVAEDPTRVEKIERRNLNRAATRIPGSRLTKPRRLGAVEPIYPELLRVQGIEADIVVTITIAADGSVTTVDVIKGAAEEFDAAAVAAARQQRFEPATRNGEPVPYTLKYTYRFRLDEVRP
jgi:protein TonB